MKIKHNGIEQWITAGLIALAVILLSYLPLSAGTATYVYDEVNRLTALKVGAVNEAEYGYDEVGNITNRSGNTPDISASPGSFGFAASVGNSSSAQTYTVQNLGLAPLYISNTTLVGTHASQFAIQNNACIQNTVSPSGNCTLEVVFSPTSEGEKNATLRTASDDPDTSELDAPLTGNGESYRLSVTLTGSGFGNVLSVPTGIDCGNGEHVSSDCDEYYQDGTEVTLTAGPDAGSTFEGWSGVGCEQAINPCVQSVVIATPVYAGFYTGGSAPQTDLAVAHSMGTKYPDAFPVHGWIRYIVKVSNVYTSGTAQGVVLEDTLPENVVYIHSFADQGYCSESDGTVTCQLGSITYGNDVNATIDVMPMIPGTALNNAVVTSTTFDVNGTDNSDTDSRRVFPSANDVDFNGDGIKDIAVYRPSEGKWYITDIYNAPSYTTVQFGTTGDIPIPGNYRGNAATELAVYRPSTGKWWFADMGLTVINSLSFGTDGDILVPGDYMGDEKLEVALYRPSVGKWFFTDYALSIYNSTDFGGIAGDSPIPGDYKDDGKAEIAFIRAQAPYDGYWYISNALDTDLYNAVDFGYNSDIPAPANYNGVSSTSEIAVYRPSVGKWFITDIYNAPSYTTVQLGGNDGDLPLPDYFKDGNEAEISLLRPNPTYGNTWKWYFTDIALSYTDSVDLGIDLDIPLSGDYKGTGSANVTIFRPSTGMWYFTDTTGSFTNSVSHGQAGDVPY